MRHGFVPGLTSTLLTVCSSCASTRREVLVLATIGESRSLASHVFASLHGACYCGFTEHTRLDLRNSSHSRQQKTTDDLYHYHGDHNNVAYNNSSTYNNLT